MRVHALFAPHRAWAWAVAAFVYQLHHLLLHHHHLHTFKYPRSDSYTLLVLEIFLCGRRLIVHAMKSVQSEASQSSLRPMAIQVGALVALSIYMIVWILRNKEERALYDALFFLPPGARTS